MRDGADHVVADVLGDLEGQRAASRRRASTSIVERVVDLGHRVGGELDVDDRADDAGDAADAARLRGLRSSRDSGSHWSLTHFPALASASASAPPTISLISWVISAWRAWLASRV